ncbi:single-stranded DNA-binding protein [Pseudoalteromonas marina]|uniref:single-stranded DNA-binding protein n=1 Tax=Pseudoalteromonas marina TaxID=267375 RepID=UPI003C68450A
MANDLNRCEFIGNVGTIETRFTAQGQAITNLSLATNESWKDKQGQKQEKVTWIPITIFGKLAEIAEKYVKKGDKIYIAGKFTVEKYQDKNTGQDKYSTKIIVDGFSGSMQMLGGKSESNQSKPSNQQSQHNQEMVGNDFNDSFDDDIPPF